MIRKLKQDDVSSLSNLLKRIDSFSEQEHDVAMELIEIAANNPLQTDYHIFVYENDDKKVVGYHCTGKRPLTDGVYDLYWIASDPDSGIKGVGQSLIKHAEEFVAA
ncbi:MAG TPA: GNAT family N-acetyltransferase, partial [Ignavibacteriaceae bacterium]|nr:GNAT family N-acetyltransferase [Ignavibacteriaceae bacterium]